MQNKQGLFEFEDRDVCLLQTTDQVFYERRFMLSIESLSYHYF